MQHVNLKQRPTCVQVYKSFITSHASMLSFKSFESTILDVISFRVRSIKEYGKT